MDANAHTHKHKHDHAHKHKHHSHPQHNQYIHDYTHDYTPPTYPTQGWISWIFHHRIILVIVLILIVITVVPWFICDYLNLSFICTIIGGITSGLKKTLNYLF
jgi:hypothetical protein